MAMRSQDGMVPDAAFQGLGDGMAQARAEAGALIDRFRTAPVGGGTHASGGSAPGQGAVQGAPLNRPTTACPLPPLSVLPTTGLPARALRARPVLAEASSSGAGSRPASSASDSSGGGSSGGVGSGSAGSGGVGFGSAAGLPRDGGRSARRTEARRRTSNERAIRRRKDPLDEEAGMATAEYAIATLAAVGFAALLVAVLSSGEVKGLLMSLITSALNFG